MNVRLPEVPAGMDDKMKDFLQAVRDILERREGLTPDKTDAFTTKTDLKEAWSLPTLLDSWVRYNEVSESPAFCKTADGFVAVKGIVASGTPGATARVFILPIGYRPAYRITMPVITNTGIGQVDVESTGEVRPISGGATWFSINIIFRHA